MKLRLDAGQLLLAAGVLLTGLVVLWVAQNTYWQEVEEPPNLRGEAAINPYYGVDRLATHLGVHVRVGDDTLQLPEPAGVILAGPWSFQVPARTQAVERWVAGGGRLVLDERAFTADDELRNWAGIERVELQDESASSKTLAFTAAGAAAEDPWGAPRHYQLCCINRYMQLKTRRAPAWTLRDEQGHLRGVRVAIGRGTVTVIAGDPFVNGTLLSGGPLAQSHALLLAEALQLHRGDVLYCLSESESPTLLPLMWSYGWPVILLALALTGLALWRAAPRFGPLEAPGARARRSLGEQIRGTGQFTLRHGGGQALLAAASRALADSAASRIRGYAALSPEAQAAALEKLTGLTRSALAAALGTQPPRNRRELYRHLLALESARRALSMPTLRSRTYADRILR